jgi:hypothetical protein
MRRTLSQRRKPGVQLGSNLTFSRDEVPALGHERQ